MRTFYDTATGRGVGNASKPNAGPVIDDNTQAVAGWHPCEECYFPGGVPTARAPIVYTVDKPVITAAGGEFATVSGLPSGCTIYFGSAEYLADAQGEFTFDALTVGLFTFVIDEVAYLRTTVVIEAI